MRRTHRLRLFSRGTKKPQRRRRMRVRAPPCENSKPHHAGLRGRITLSSTTSIDGMVVARMLHLLWFAAPFLSCQRSEAAMNKRPCATALLVVVVIVLLAIVCLAPASLGAVKKITPLPRSTDQPPAVAVDE